MNTNPKKNNKETNQAAWSSTPRIRAIIAREKETLEKLGRIPQLDKETKNMPRLPRSTCLDYTHTVPLA